MAIQKAKFSIGDIVKHKHFEFRGVIYDVDFELIIQRMVSVYSKKCETKKRSTILSFAC